MKANSIQDFWKKVNIRGAEKCWEWLGTFINLPGGYGRFVYHRKVYLAHRFCYIISYGAIPPNMYVCHHCDNPSCINPNHLFMGTSSDNALDRSFKGRNPNNSGVLSGKHILTEEQVLEIKRSSETASFLSKKFNTCLSNVYTIRSGKSWRHLVAQQTQTEMEKLKNEIELSGN
jgi:hypothetical protein